MRRGHARPEARPRDSRAEASWNELRAACRRGDAKTMRDAWIRNVAARSNVAPDQAAEMIRRHPEGRPLLDALNRVLYSANAAETPPGREIIEATRAMLQPAQEAPAPGLPELHPH